MSKSCSKWHTVDHSSSHSSRWWLKRCAERFQCQATIVLHWCKNKTELTTITWVSRMRKIPGQMLTSPFWGSEPWVISHTTCTNKNKRYYCCVCVCERNPESKGKAGGPWTHRWHGPTKTHLCRRENVPASEMARWPSQKPPMPTCHDMTWHDMLM